MTMIVIGKFSLVPSS